MNRDYFKHLWKWVLIAFVALWILFLAGYLLLQTAG